MANGFVLLLIINTSDTTKNFKKRLERQTLYTGCSKAEPKNFTPPQTALPRAQEGQNLVSWRWSPLPDIARVQSLKVLGVTISSSLSLSEHVNSVISSCACSQYATKVLRAHDLCDTASQEVYKSVVVGKLLYASPAWCMGFASATDRQRVEAVLRRGVRSGLYPSQQTANGMVDSADDKLFELVLQSGDCHVLHELLTDRVDIFYNLRSCSHDRVLPQKKGHLTDKNVLTRMLYKNTY